MLSCSCLFSKGDRSPPFVLCSLVFHSCSLTLLVWNAPVLVHSMIWDFSQYPNSIPDLSPAPSNARDVDSHFCLEGCLCSAGRCGLISGSPRKPWSGTKSGPGRLNGPQGTIGSDKPVRSICFRDRRCWGRWGEGQRNAAREGVMGLGWNIHGRRGDILELVFSKHSERYFWRPRIPQQFLVVSYLYDEGAMRLCK